MQRKTRQHEEFSRSRYSLEHAAFAPHVDYRKKRGLVEEINRAVEMTEADAAARAELRPPPTVETGPVK
jgi:DNA-directed RNA polymerase subunit F